MNGCARRVWLNQRRDPANAPPIYLCDECHFCRWNDQCHTTAEAEKNITLLNGMSRRAWESLTAAGITTVDQLLSHTVESLCQFNGIGMATARQMHTSARAIQNGDAILLAPVPDELRRPHLMLDIETSLDFGNEGQPWSFGWSDVQGNLQAMIVAKYFEGDHLLLPDGRRVQIVEHYTDAWRMLAEYAAAHDLKIYHWSGFDASVMKQTAAPDVVEVLSPRMKDLLHIFKQTVMLPVRGRSIKKVAAYLGYAYPPESDYRQAWNDYQLWMLENDDEALARAMAYQLADVEAMLIARDWLIKRNA